jgi:hypothetical protein
MYLSIAVVNTQPPSLLKNEGKSVPPPKRLIRSGVCTMIIAVLFPMNGNMQMSGETHTGISH